MIIIVPNKYVENDRRLRPHNQFAMRSSVVDSITTMNDLWPGRANMFVETHKVRRPLPWIGPSTLADFYKQVGPLGHGSFLVDCFATYITLL